MTFFIILQVPFVMFCQCVIVGRNLWWSDLQNKERCVLSLWSTACPFLPWIRNISNIQNSSDHWVHVEISDFRFDLEISTETHVRLLDSVDLICGVYPQHHF